MTTAEVTKPDGSKGEIEVRELEVGEVLNEPHHRVEGGQNYTVTTCITTYYTTKGADLDGPMRKVTGPLDKITHNPQCDGTVRVTGPVPGMENLAWVGAACDACEFKTRRESYVIA